MTQSLLLPAAAMLIAGSLASQRPIPEDRDPKTTASGLMYSVLEAGDPLGEVPGMGDQVRVHYTGWLTDGKEFDSSHRCGDPAKFVLGQVIAGWNEGLQLMKPGAKYKLTIPYPLAYGENGRPPTIPAKATLIFEVDLLSVSVGPKFQRPNPEKQKSSEAGFKYEVLKPGEGDGPTKTETVELEYAFFNTEGELMQCSAFAGGPIKKPPEQLEKFLQHAPLLMKPGGKLLLEVPASVGFGAQDTIWTLELVRVIKPMPIPAFHKPDDSELTRTASGLGYQVLQAGEGESPKMGQEVEVHYAGWLTDGTLFDSSFGSGEPSRFRLGMVIKGWNEGLQLMKPGAVFRLVIPPELGYGAQGSGATIGPDATLIFHVELTK